MTGGFSRAIELMVHEHHYKIKEVLEMPICTVRQQIELIQQRKKAESNLFLKSVEWQTKIFVSGLSAIAMSEESGKELAKFAERLELKFDDDDDSPRAAAKNDTRSIEEIMEQGALIDLDRVPVYEKMSTRLGGIVSRS